ncbi:MAG: 2-oxoacid:acceptor oxidoreductase family protein [Syntrophales bacterium]|jgi:2-oxoglutarate ferredoxin oxidoreductase subunit gamma|nr:2-oxoacid:acceptor oxidoreductase family protein [Syntrophales bacterium]MCK9527316.1 2-oxoacid:acceptor oxidoreductase family protein [Syntrophales bacterium]MDX9921214.1 2-oxoacid:acceptor oxidoreductase family protein [Syntrophales bacterium]
MKKTVFAGFGGQGVLMMGYVFAVAAMRDGQHVTYLPSYGAEMRGGTANCTVAVSDDEIFSPVASEPDFAVIMNKPSLTRYENMMRSGGTVFLNSSVIDRDLTREDISRVLVPAGDMAGELGSPRVLNMIMLGAFVARTRLTTLESIMNGLEEIIKGKSSSVIKLNRKALDRGAGYVMKGLSP